MTKRPKYVDGIGIFRGSKETTAWIKIRLANGGVYKEKTHPPGSALEIKLGKHSSWGWDQLENKRDEMQGRADRGEALEDKPPILFKDWSQDWLARAKSRLKSHSIVRAHVSEHLAPAFGNLAINAITVSSINNWIAGKLIIQKPATVKRELDTLKAILNDAIRSGHLEKNPCDLVNPIKGIVGRQRFLDGAEIIELLAAAEKTEDWLPDFILWALHSGMRKSEILSLVWKDIGTLPKGQTYATVRHGKDDRTRMVYCTITMMEILANQRKRRQTNNDHVFPIAKMTLRRKWEKARTAASLKDVTLHDLRRTHGTLAAAAGVDLRTLADRIGHADLTMLQKHYAALVGTAAVEAAETIQKTFDKAIKKSS